MPPRNKKKNTFHLFGLEINLNVVATTIFGSVSWVLITYGIGWAKTNNEAIHKTLPAIQQDVGSLKTSVKNIQAEQARVRAEYVPPVKTP